MDRILIYGTGGLSKLLSSNLKQGTKLLAYVDDTEKAPNNINSIPVITSNRIHELDFDYIVIGFSNVESGIKELRALGIEDKRIVGYSFISDKPYSEEYYQLETDFFINNKISNAFYLVIQKVLGHETVLGWTSTISVIMIIGGLILFVLGICGEYIGRIYMSINNTPQYIIKEQIGFDDGK